MSENVHHIINYWLNMKNVSLFDYKNHSFVIFFYSFIAVNNSSSLDFDAKERIPKLVLFTFVEIIRQHINTQKWANFCFKFTSFAQIFLKLPKHSFKHSNLYLSFWNLSNFLLKSIYFLPKKIFKSSIEYSYLQLNCFNYYRPVIKSKCHVLSL